MRELSTAVELCVKHTVNINYNHKAQHEKQAVRLDPNTENNVVIQPCYFYIYFENCIYSNMYSKEHTCVFPRPGAMTCQGVRELIRSLGG